MFGFESQRSSGYVAQMDPKHATSGFERSIVLRAGLASADVRAGARGSASRGSAAVVPGAPNLLATGVSLRTPSFKGLTATGGKATLRIPFKIKDRGDLPKDIQASVRWDPIDVAPAPTDPPTEVAVEPPMPAVPDESPAATPPSVRPLLPLNERDEAPESSPTASPTASPEPLPPTAPPVDLVLVAPERIGDVVAPADLKIGSKYLSVPVTMPTAPGRYRLTVTLHDGDGVAFDAATQAALPTLAVRVTGDPDGAILVTPTTRLTAGSDVGARRSASSTSASPPGGTGRSSTRATRMVSMARSRRPSSLGGCRWPTAPWPRSRRTPGSICRPASSRGSRPTPC